MKMTKKYDDLNDAFDVSDDIVQPEVVEKKIDKIIWVNGYEIVLDMSYFSFDQPDVYGKSWIKKKSGIKSKLAQLH